MDAFFNCRKASNGRPLQGAASASVTGSGGPEGAWGGGVAGAGVVAASVLRVGATVASARGVVAASETSSTSLKVSPRETEEDGGGA